MSFMVCFSFVFVFKLCCFSVCSSELNIVFITAWTNVGPTQRGPRRAACSSAVALGGSKWSHHCRGGGGRASRDSLLQLQMEAPLMRMRMRSSSIPPPERELSWKCQLSQSDPALRHFVHWGEAHELGWILWMELARSCERVRTKARA